MVQGKINRDRHNDHPAGRHSIRTNQCPPPPSPPYFYGPDALPAAQPTVSKPWRQLAHSDQGEDARNLLNGVTCTVSISHRLRTSSLMITHLISVLSFGGGNSNNNNDDDNDDDDDVKNSNYHRHHYHKWWWLIIIIMVTPTITYINFFPNPSGSLIPRVKKIFFK